jgi:hypothetical protein
MITLIWKEEKSKRVELKMKSGTATLHFIKDLEINIPDVIWPELKKKLSDAINTKRLEVIEGKKEKKLKKNTQIKDEDEIDIEEL